MNEKKLRLIGNGLCFLRQSIRHFKQSSKEDYNSEKELKYSILHLLSGISLILKEKLRQEHWSLLFSDVNEANKKDLESGDFRGVTFINCQNRLSNISSVKLTNKQQKMLNSLRKKRNKIEHFFEQETLDAFKSTLIHNLDFAIYFIENNLNLNLSGNEKRDMEKIKKECFKIKEFVKQKRKLIWPSLENQKVVLYCSECDNESIVVDKGNMEVHCLFCHRVISKNEYENFYYDSQRVHKPKHLILVDNMICPGCDSENHFVETTDKKNYFCLYCHYTAIKDSFCKCAGCGIIYQENSQEDGSYNQCPSCWKRFFSQ